ncbi:glutathione S-transferase family protein [Burkholderia gladioli]|uniref:glutathione S-transferase family protein n=1 Tax=Burkholderia gladioli TaxID=28095 RepID=UPI0016413DF0|nr:glutathione S-transferase family protein [Burkholderia gladioli]
MKLIGMLDSPYVRRAAVSAKLLGLSFEHQPLSVFRHFDEFRAVNPVVKAPTLLTDDGTMLLDSSLICDYLDHLVEPDRRLLPVDAAARLRSLELIGLALAAAEKTVQVVYECGLRPDEKLHQPWLDRVVQQLDGAYAALEARVLGTTGWLLGERITQADVTLAVVWRFTQYVRPDHPALAAADAERYPSIAALSARAEALPEFAGTPLD